MVFCFNVVVYGCCLWAGLMVKSVVGLWVCIEVCLYVVIIFMILNRVAIGTAIYYYVVQTLGSGLMVWGYFIYPPLIVLGVALKFGLFPFSFWVFSVVKSVNSSFILFLVLGVQKMLPLVYIIQYVYCVSSLFLIRLIGCLVGVVFILGFADIDRILSGSSVIHSS